MPDTAVVNLPFNTMPKTCEVLKRMFVMKESDRPTATDLWSQYELWTATLDPNAVDFIRCNLGELYNKMLPNMAFKSDSDLDYGDFKGIRSDYIAFRLKNARLQLPAAAPGIPVGQLGAVAPASGVAPHVFEMLRGRSSSESKRGEGEESKVQPLGSPTRRESSPPALGNPVSSISSTSLSFEAGGDTSKKAAKFLKLLQQRQSDYLSMLEWSSTDEDTLEDSVKELLSHPIHLEARRILRNRKCRM
jgi:hypothetical protein